MMEAITGVVRGNQGQSAPTTQYLMSKAIRFHRRPSEVLKRQSSGQQEAFSDHQRRTLVASPEMVAALRCPANASRAAVAYLMREAIRQPISGNQWQSGRSGVPDEGGHHQRPSSEAIIRGHHQRPSKAIRGHQTYARSRRSSSASQRTCGAAPACAESHSPAPHPSSKRYETPLTLPSGS